MSFPRYPKYKASGVEWLGDVPEHWEIVALKRIANLKSGDSITGEIIEETGDYPVLGGNGLRGFTSAYTHDGHFVVIGRQGALCGNINYATGKFWASEHAVVASPLKQVETVWLGEMLRAMNLNQHSVSAAQPGLSMEFVGNLRTVLPPIAEQGAVASFLDRETAKIDGLVEEQRRLMELLKEKRQAVISHAVTQGLNPHAPRKPSGIEWLGDVPEHWEVRRVKTVSSFVTSGPRGWSERIGEVGSLFVQSGDLNERLEVEFATAKRVQTDNDAESARTRLCNGDVVVCVTGAKTGNVAVCDAIPEAAYVNQHLCLVRPNSDVLPLFLGVLLKSRLGQTFFEVSQYGLKQGLSLEDVKEAPVILPPADEQAEIIKFVSESTTRFDNLTAEAQRAIDLLQERRTALISAAVTGQIDVRGLAPSGDAA